MYNFMSCLNSDGQNFTQCSDKFALEFSRCKICKITCYAALLRDRENRENREFGQKNSLQGKYREFDNGVLNTGKIQGIFNWHVKYREFLKLAC